MQIIAILVASAIPLVFLFVIYGLDLYKTGEFRSVILCFIWGGIAFGGAYYINPAVGKYLHLDWNTQVVRFSAPIVEEILKALILVYLVRRPNFTYFVDGAIYGFAAGIGFAVFENIQYITGAPNQAIGTAVSRVLSTNLMHASASAMVGIALGLARFRRFSGRLALLIGGLVLAMGLHAFYNNFVTRVNTGMLLIFAAIIGFSAAGFIAYAMNRGLQEEKTWIEETLGAADRVTAGEAAVVHRLENVDDILAPLAKSFGEEKAAKIQKFLVTQARLGIMRKTLEKLTDEKMLKAVEKQMGELRKEMDVARRDVGSYAMLYLRHIFPAEASPLWGRLETLIQERAAARPATGGPNLWATLQKRAEKPAPASEDQEAKPSDPTG